MGDVRLKKSKSVLLNRAKYPCQNYINNTFFTKCALKTMVKMLSAKAIDCVTPYWNNFEEFDIPVCSNLNSTHGKKLNQEISKVNGNFIRNEGRIIYLPLY